MGNLSKMKSVVAFTSLLWSLPLGTLAQDGSGTSSDHYPDAMQAIPQTQTQVFQFDYVKTSSGGKISGHVRCGETGETCAFTDVSSIKIYNNPVSYSTGANACNADNLGDVDFTFGSSDISVDSEGVMTDLTLDSSLNDLQSIGLLDSDGDIIGCGNFISTDATYRFLRQKSNDVYCSSMAGADGSGSTEGTGGAFNVYHSSIDFASSQVKLFEAEDCANPSFETFDFDSMNRKQWTRVSRTDLTKTTRSWSIDATSDGGETYSFCFDWDDMHAISSPNARMSQGTAGAQPVDGPSSTPSSTPATKALREVGTPLFIVNLVAGLVALF